MADTSPTAALPDGAAPPAPPPPRALPQQSMSQRIQGYLRYYDADGNGVLDDDEQAHALGDLARSQDSEKRSADAAILMAVRNTRLNIWLVLALVGMVIAALVIGDRAFSGVNGSIERTAVTAVTVDHSGAAHLVDKSSGREMSTRGTGDLYSAARVEVRGRVLHCIPVASAADMVDSLAQGANVRLALLSRDGSLEERIVSLGADFEDAGDVLRFGDGRVDVLLDDDSCNVREEQGEGEGGEEEEEEGAEEGGGDGGRIFGGRGLGPAAQTSRESVLARNRAIYSGARKGIRAGGQRILDGGQGGNLVPVVYGAGGNAGPLLPPTPPPTPNAGPTPPTMPPAPNAGLPPTMPPAPNAGLPPTMPPAPNAAPTPPPSPSTPNAAPTPPPSPSTPNVAPTPPPTPNHAPCPSGEDRITVDVTTDEYPDLTEWWFYNGCTGSTKIQDELFSESFTLYSQSFCESGGQYTFNIQSFGFQFSGSYTVTLNDQVIKQGGAFQWYDTTQFGASSC